MVAIVAGQSFGLGQTSARTLGASGMLGNPATGYLGSSFFVNAASGNVVIQNQDEILTGVGQDTVLSRTYNSLGLLDDDNGDNWRESPQRTVAGLTGTVNTAGSTITRTDWDGSRQVFTWDATKSAYIFKDPAGSLDKLTYSAGTSQWAWTDGDSRVTELYDNTNAGRIVSSLDPDGKGQTFTYTGSQLTRITDSNGEYVVLAWSGSNLTQLSTYKSDNTLLVSRVRYGYDGSNRLTTVTVDLSPSDNAITDGKTVVYPSAAATSYTVQSGDTLYSIARALWGDQAMWFLIAEANGITATTQLVPGQRLIIPNKVTNFHNASGTFRVYDPGEAIGDTMPTLPNEPAPPPAKKKGCGGFGAILLGIIAIAVTIVTAGAGIALATGTNLASGISTVVGTSVLGGAVAGGGVIGALGGGLAGTLAAVGIGAASAAAGSIVSQGIGVATGLQDSFSWKAVGLSALGGGLAGGASGLNVFRGATGAARIANVVVRSALTNAAMQGIGVATGLQDRFSWSGVAAAGVGAGIGSALAGSGFASSLGPVGGRIVSGVAGGLAVSAAESLVAGRDFGDTLAGNLPGMIVNTVGSIMANRIAGRGELTTGAGDGASAQPATGKGGGQVGIGGDEIVVTAPRSSFSQYVDYFPQVTAVLMANDVRTGGSEHAAAQLKARIVHQLATQASTASSRSAAGYAALDAIDGKRNGIPSVAGWASTKFELTMRAMGAEADFAAGAYDANVYGGIKASLAANSVMIYQWDAIADSQVNEVLRGGLAAADIGIGGYNIATGNGGFRDYLAIGSLVPFGKILGAVERGAESGIARAVRLGQEGEAAAGITGSKVGVTINGRMRFPDEITEFAIKEVKNVARQGWTRQLRDYADLARLDGKTFELWIRPDTRISRILDAAEQHGDVAFKFIGGR